MNYFSDMRNKIFVDFWTRQRRSPQPSSNDSSLDSPLYANHDSSYFHTVSIRRSYVRLRSFGGKTLKYFSKKKKKTQNMPFYL